METPDDYYKETMVGTAHTETDRQTERQTDGSSLLLCVCCWLCVQLLLEEHARVFASELKGRRPLTL